MLEGGQEGDAPWCLAGANGRLLTHQLRDSQDGSFPELGDPNIDPKIL